jgi:UDP-N-acetylglucosamine 2-epimerase (non-hydrolysing)
LPALGGHAGSGPLLCVVGGQADHVKAAALMVALAARHDVPAALLVRAGNSEVTDRNAALFSGLDRGRFIQLAIGDGTAVGRAAELMKRFEFVVDHCEPSAVVVFDGSEVALYAGLVASHKNVPVLHVGAGLRVRDAFAKADATRRLLDEVSDVLYAPDAEATAQLVREGVPAARVRFVGNLLVDAMQNALRAPADASREGELAVVQAFLADRHGYAVVVADAMAGASNRQGLSDLVAMMRQVSRDVPLIWPMQAYTRDQLVKFKLDAGIADERIVCMPTLPYASFVQLLGNATCVLTDSWSVQEEATALGIPCLTLGNEPGRFGASKVGGSTAVGNNKALATRAVWECIFNGGKRSRVPDLWDGQAAGRIAEHIAKWLAARRATPMA